ncbi:MAG: hypothetical protein HZA90_04130 [Verrucomicrobia bacterium]|nr:hypothetical protein [Verrucomicrobiota bacterium]
MNYVTELIQYATTYHRCEVALSSNESEAALLEPRREWGQAGGADCSRIQRTVAIREA